jgi:hypothetical protein
MTVRKGEAWGSVGPAPAGMLTAVDDRELRHIVCAALAAGVQPPPVGLLGGDLMRAVGGSGDPGRFAGDVAILPVDVLRVEVDGVVDWCCCHVVARRRWWRGEIVAAMNAQHVGAWDVAPRAHPGDGKVDVVRADPAMSWRDRARARSRLALGTHVPHPHIEVRQRSELELEFDRPLRLELDGEVWMRASSVRIVVLPDALTVVV